MPVVETGAMKKLKYSALAGMFLLGALATTFCATITLTVSDIVRMSKAGLSDDVIIQTIQSTGSKFRLNAEDIELLKRDSISDRVVAAMQAPDPAASSFAKPAEPATLVVREPSGRDYVGGMVEQPVVRALPVAPPVYYAAPPPPVYYYSYPYYYSPPYYCYGSPLRFYFSYGHGHRHW